MRKVKKINGYLIVKFSDRERRTWEQLGAYGVIDADLYTGDIDIDRGVMEYDDAETLEAATEQARGLEAEPDANEAKEEPTIIHETDEDALEAEADPQLLIDGWEATLVEQIKSGFHPNVNPMTARHELYGFKVALRELGLLAPGECYVLPGVFGSEDLEDADAADLFTAMKERLARQIVNPRYPDTDERTATHELYGYALALRDVGLIKEFDQRFLVLPDTFKGVRQVQQRENFKNLPDEITAEAFALAAARKVYALGLVLLEDCPDNDCRVYLNTFNMARELDEAIDTAKGYAANMLRRKLAEIFRELREMYRTNYAVQTYRREAGG